MNNNLPIMHVVTFHFQSGLSGLCEVSDNHSA